MKTASQIADGFPRQDKGRAHCLRKLAYTEGFTAALAIIEGMLSARDLNDPELIESINLWIKEMKQNDGQPVS